MSVSGLHEELIQRFIHLNWGAQRNKFARAVAANVRGGVAALKEYGAWPLGIIPDAFIVEVGPEWPIITAVEVEVSSHLNLRKIEAYVDLWCALDDFGVELKLTRIDAIGIETHVDLWEMRWKLHDAYMAISKRVNPEWWGEKPPEPLQ